MELVLSEKKGRVGFITLNRPQALNSLNLEMIQALRRHLDVASRDPAIEVIYLNGAGGKAFCAGGDVKAIGQLGMESVRKALPYAKDFFAQEYGLDYALHRYPKPVIAEVSGLVMGGGLGLALGARYRLATETTRMSMPEIRIGFFPDVGASYFLSRMPKRLGLFLALTAFQVEASDAVRLGLATNFVPADRLDDLRQRLFAGEAWERVIEELSVAPTPGVLAMHEENVTRLMGEDSLEEIFERFRTLQGPDWLREATQTALRGSPASAVVMNEQFRRAVKLSLEACFAQDLRLALRFCELPDFYEGVRSVLIEKGRSPRWQSSSLGEIRLEDYFDFC